MRKMAQYQVREGEWSINGSAEMNGTTYPLSGLMKIRKAENKWIEDYTMEIDFGGKKVPFIQSMTFPVLKKKDTSFDYILESDKTGKAEGKAQILPNALVLTDENKQTGMTTNHFQMWKNEDEATNITYQLDDKGKQVQVWVLNKKRIK
jgi:hypothetical protein